jgi:hypothetical protein
MAHSKAASCQPGKESPLIGIMLDYFGSADGVGTAVSSSFSHLIMHIHSERFEKDGQKHELKLVIPPILLITN